MKKTIFKLFIAILLLVSSSLYSYEDSFTIHNLITSIQSPTKPIEKDGYVIFTADSSARSVGIVFDFEDFSRIHQFEKLVTYDSNNEPVSSVLFYILKTPPKISSISYKLIIDGLWTLDPLNTVTSYNPTSNIRLNMVMLEDFEENKTENIGNNIIRFVYQGNPGKKIRLAGTFTNWDSFIYELQETSPGFYEITLPLPSGKHYYAYYSGTESFIDKKNPNKVYTADGRKASVLILQ